MRRRSVEAIFDFEMVVVTHTLLSEVVLVKPDCDEVRCANDTDNKTTRVMLAMMLGKCSVSSVIRNGFHDHRFHDQMTLACRP